LFPDVVVDVSYMFCITLKREDIGNGYFLTCKSHKQAIEQQMYEYEHLATDSGFWSFVSNQRRRAIIPSHRRIEELIRSGIPPKYRSKMWQTMCGTLLKPLQFLPYSNIFGWQGRKEETLAQIAQDVNRTFPALGTRVFIERLSRVLTAYSIRNPKLGYCQSMNFLAATLLIFMEEEQAFWMLAYMVEELLHNYYVPSMSGFHVDAQLFETLVAEHLPELSKHFQRSHLSVAILTAPWFLCLFVNDLPSETSYVVWDNLMKDGIITIFEVGLAILRMFQNELFKFDDQADLIQHLRKRTASLYEPANLRRHWHSLDKNKITKRRETIRKRVDEEAIKATIKKQFCELELQTHFFPEELEILWRHYITFDPFFRYGSTGLDSNMFGQFVRGTFGEWLADSHLVEWLFMLSDVNKDGFVDFPELVMLLSVMCRGTFRQIVRFNFHLFDMESKGSVTEDDILRMLCSVYAMFMNDPGFDSLLRFFVMAIFDTCPRNEDGSISLENFDYVVSIQPQIMHRFKARNPKAKYDPKKTYYYWMFDNRPKRLSEVIQISLDRKSIFSKQPPFTHPRKFVSITLT
jgi:Ca2+-binding EF-hand superfamily protein